MTQREYEEIKNILADAKKVTRDELLKIIIKVNPKRNPEYLRFYIFDLVNNEIIYKLNEKFYKYNDKLKSFEYEYTKFEEPIRTKLEEKFEGVNICIWNTSFLSTFQNLLPVINYTFIEVDSNFIEYLYNYMKNDYNVLLDPSEKDLELYAKGNDRVVIKKLFARSPIVKPYHYDVAINKNIKTKRSFVFKPTIEKILVDIFVDSKLYDVFNDIDDLYRGIFKTYCVNFQKLFAYSRYRGISDELSKYILNRIKFDFNIGEFL